MSDNAHHVAAVVLNWNNYDDTAECLHGLLNQSYHGLEPLVVDNGSTDGSYERLQQEIDGVRILRNDENRGFTGGMNRGIDYALSEEFEYVLLVNNDVRFPDPDIVQRLIEKYRSESLVGALSPMTTTEVETTNSDSDCPFIPRNGRTGYSQFDSEVSDPDLSYGCDYSCVLFSRKLLELVGSFDDRYFLYFEDIEHGTRIKNQGHHLATDRTVTVKHESHGSSSSPIGPVPSYYDARNRLLFMDQYNSRWEYSYLIPLYAWWFCTRLAYRLYRQNTAGAIAMVRGIADAIRRQTGKGPYP